jgi:hypothetical protein
VADILSTLERESVPCAEVREPAQAIRDPRVVERGDTVPLAHPVHGRVADIYGTGLPVTFSEASSGFDRPRPRWASTIRRYGQWLGYSAERLDELRAGGVIDRTSGRFAPSPAVVSIRAATARLAAAQATPSAELPAIDAAASVVAGIESGWRTGGGDPPTWPWTEVVGCSTTATSNWAC